MSVDEKRSKAAEIFLADLTEGTQAALRHLAGGPLAPRREPEPADDEAEAAGRVFAEGLSPEARRALAGCPAGKPLHSEPETATHRYAVVESPDGGWATLRTFRNAEGLVRRLQQLEGTDTVVWCFYGLPLGVTKGVPRYLELPNGKQMMQIPLSEGGPVPTVDADSLTKVPLQADGFLGPPELSQPKPAVTTPATAASGDDDDE